MTIGVSLFLITVGAILTFAIEIEPIGSIDIGTAGVILMAVGVFGFVLEWTLLAPRRRRLIRGENEVVEDRRYRRPGDPPEPPPA